MVFIETTVTKLDNKMNVRRMFADSTEELDRMAQMIGLHPDWKQLPGTPVEHFQVVASKRHLAVKFGALDMRPEDVEKRLRERTYTAKRVDVTGLEQWEAVRRAAREIADISETIESSVKEVGVRASLEKWAAAVRRIVLSTLDLQRRFDKIRLDEMDRAAIEAGAADSQDAPSPTKPKRKRKAAR